MTTTQYRVIGTRPVRHDGADKVTGKAIYTADTKLPGMLAGFVLRSPHAHAKIISILHQTFAEMILPNPVGHDARGQRGCLLYTSDAADE